MLSDAVGVGVEGADLVCTRGGGRSDPARGDGGAGRAPRAARASLSAIAGLEEIGAEAWSALVDERLGAAGWAMIAGRVRTGARGGHDRRERTWAALVSIPK